MLLLMQEHSNFVDSKEFDFCSDKENHVDGINPGAMECKVHAVGTVNVVCCMLVSACVA